MAAPQLESSSDEEQAAVIAAYIQRTVDAIPPVTPEQHARVAALLRGGVDGGS